MLMLMLVGGCWTLGAAAGVPPSATETPRATDLLKAERLAAEIRRRLELPPAPAEAGWQPGGQGWKRRESSAKVATDGDVIINVKPPAARPGGTR